MLYPIDISKNILNIIPNDKSLFFICLFKIIKCNTPYVCFYLFKNKTNDSYIYTFLYTYFKKSRKCTFDNIDKLLSNIDLNNELFKGFKQIENNFYLFYQLDDNTSMDDKKMFTKMTIYEISQMQECFTIPIHYTAVELFYKCPQLHYIYNNQLQKYNMPITIYNSKIDTLDILSNYDKKKNKYFIRHDYNKQDNKHLRFILHISNNFSNIHKNKFYFDNIHQIELLD